MSRSTRQGFNSLLAQIRHGMLVVTTGSKYAALVLDILYVASEITVADTHLLGQYESRYSCYQHLCLMRDLYIMG